MSQKEDPLRRVWVGGRQFSRRELYDWVWSKPVLAISNELGISNQAVSKACRRAKIPTPPPGHWAKKAAGKRVTVQPFVEVVPELIKPPRKTKPRPTVEERSAAIRALTAELTTPQSKPRPLDPPLSEYRCEITAWGWSYHIGEQGEGFLPGAKDFDVWLEFEDVIMRGVMVSPDHLGQMPVVLAIQPAAPKRRFSYTSLDRAHVGNMEFRPDRVFAEIVMPQSAASRLLQISISGRVLNVVLKTEPNVRANTEIVVTLDIEVVAP